MTHPTKQQEVANCDDWTKIAMHCKECGVQFFRKVKGQRYCDDHRHLAGSEIRPKEALTSQPMTHFGDPCIHCGIPHDDVPPGPCTGDPAKAVPIAYRSLGVRWDGVECCLIRLSDRRVIERHNHITENSPYWHFGWSDDIRHPPRWDDSLTPQDITP